MTNPHEMNLLDQADPPEQGEATLIVAGKPVQLKAGDHVFLPAGVAHMVKITSQGAMWLAVHLHTT